MAFNIEDEPAAPQRAVGAVQLPPLHDRVDHTRLQEKACKSRGRRYSSFICV